MRRDLQYCALTLLCYIDFISFYSVLFISTYSVLFLSSHSILFFRLILFSFFHLLVFNLFFSLYSILFNSLQTPISFFTSAFHCGSLGASLGRGHANAERCREWGTLRCPYRALSNRLVNHNSSDPADYHPV